MCTKCHYGTNRKWTSTHWNAMWGHSEHFVNTMAHNWDDDDLMSNRLKTSSDSGMMGIYILEERLYIPLDLKLCKCVCHIHFIFTKFIFKKRGISPRMEMATAEHFRSFWTLLYFLLHFAASCISISDDVISHGTYYPLVFWIRAESNEGVSQVGAILTALHIRVVWVWSAWGMVLLKLYWVGQKTPHCPLQRLPLCFSLSVHTQTVYTQAITQKSIQSYFNNT